MACTLEDAALIREILELLRGSCHDSMYAFKCMCSALHRCLLLGVPRSTCSMALQKASHVTDTRALIDTLGAALSTQCWEDVSGLVLFAGDTLGKADEPAYTDIFPAGDVPTDIKPNAREACVITSEHANDVYLEMVLRAIQRQEVRGTDAGHRRGSPTRVTDAGH